MEYYSRYRVDVPAGHYRSRHGYACLTGADVFTALRRAGVTVPIILISAYDIVVREGFFAVLTEPFNLRALADTVAAAVDQGRATTGA